MQHGHFKGIAKAASRKAMRFAKRQQVIKCCGKASCFNIKLKKKPRDRNATQKITAQFKTNQRSTVTHADIKIQTLSSLEADITSEPIFDETSSIEKSSNPTEEATNTMDTKSGEIADVSDQILTIGNESSTKGPLADETTYLTFMSTMSLEKPISSDLMGAPPGNATEAITLSEY
jgi:hypothetical protein